PCRKSRVTVRVVRAPSAGRSRARLSRKAGRARSSGVGAGTGIEAIGGGGALGGGGGGASGGGGGGASGALGRDEATCARAIPATPIDRARATPHMDCLVNMSISI